MRRGVRRNTAEVLLQALNEDDLEGKALDGLGIMMNPSMG
jgi:hypothetical protein